MGSALFVPCYYDGLARDSGSARIRAEWVCRYWDGAEVYDGSQRWLGGGGQGGGQDARGPGGPYDVYVFQKAYLTAEPRKWIRAVARWRERGLPVLLAFDLCDPDFLEEEHKRRMLGVLPSFDFAVATTEPLREWLGQWLPAYVVPDRVDVQGLREMGLGFKEITGTSEPRLVWAGYGRNVEALEALLPTVRELGLGVDILAVERPKPFGEFWAEILEYDVLLNPRPEAGPYRYKSDNKTLIAWALGMPVARTAEDLWMLCDPVARGREVGARWSEVLEQWDVRLSVEEWRRIVAGFREADVR